MDQSIYNLLTIEYRGFHIVSSCLPYCQPNSRHLRTAQLPVSIGASAYYLLVANQPFHYCLYSGTPVCGPSSSKNRARTTLSSHFAFKPPLEASSSLKVRLVRWLFTLLGCILAAIFSRKTSAVNDGTTILKGPRPLSRPLRTNAFLIT